MSQSYGGGGPNLFKLFKILGIPTEKLIPITKPMKFKTIILPDESFFNDIYGNKFLSFTNEFLETIERIRYFAFKNQYPTEHKKIYLYHGYFGRVHEPILAKYFQQKGYTVIQPEKLSLEEQLNLYISCDSFASTIGSCSHNSIFTKIGTEIILIPRGIGITSYQLALDQIHEKNITYVDSSLAAFDVEGRLSLCYIVSEKLKKYFGEKWTGYSAEDFEAFLQYIIFENSQGQKSFGERAKKYYGNVLIDFINQLKNQHDLMKKYGVVFS